MVRQSAQGEGGLFGRCLRWPKWLCQIEGGGYGILGGGLLITPKSHVWR